MMKTTPAKYDFLRKRAQQLYANGMDEHARRLLTRIDEAQAALFTAYARQMGKGPETLQDKAVIGR